jgi:hypothetical protein
MHQRRARPSSPAPTESRTPERAAPAHHGHAGHDHGSHVHAPEAIGAAPDTSLLAAVAASTAGTRHALGRQASPAPADATAQRRSRFGVDFGGTGVSPTAVDVLERTVAALAGHRADIQERLEEANTRMVIIPDEAKMTDLPEFASLRGTRTFDGRNWDDTRGSGGMAHGDEWVIGTAEENLVDVPGTTDPYGPNYSVALHELAHTIHLKGISRDERARVDALFAAQAGAAFSDTYGSSNSREYFAQSTNVFFGVNALGANGPEWLQAQDPDMYAFLVTIYGTPEAAMERVRAVGAPAAAAEVEAAAATAPTAASPTPTASPAPAPAS